MGRGLVCIVDRDAPLIDTGRIRRNHSGTPESLRRTCMDTFIWRAAAFRTALAFLLLAFTLSAQAQFTLDRETIGPSSRKTGLVITEIMYNPKAVPGLPTNLTHEFIEVYNSKPWAEDMSGFAIAGSVSF